MHLWISDVLLRVHWLGPIIGHYPCVSIGRKARRRTVPQPEPPFHLQGACVGSEQAARQEDLRAKPMTWSMKMVSTWPDETADYSGALRLLPLRRVSLA
jgi:hypothetical protein